MSFTWLNITQFLGALNDNVFSNVMGLSARQGFLILGWLTLFLTVCVFVVLPDFLARFMAVIVTRRC